MKRVLPFFPELSPSLIRHFEFLVEFYLKRLKTLKIDSEVMNKNEEINFNFEKSTCQNVAETSKQNVKRTLICHINLLAT